MKKEMSLTDAIFGLAKTNQQLHDLDTMEFDDYCEKYDVKVPKIDTQKVWEELEAQLKKTMV